MFALHRGMNYKRSKSWQIREQIKSLLRELMHETPVDDYGTLLEGMLAEMTTEDGMLNHQSKLTLIKPYRPLVS
jgi:hypothetical protein